MGAEICADDPPTQRGTPHEEPESRAHFATEVAPAELGENDRLVGAEYADAEPSERTRRAAPALRAPQVCSLARFTLVLICVLSLLWLVLRKLFDSTMQRAPLGILNRDIILLTLNPLGDVGWSEKRQDEHGWPNNASERRQTYESNWECYARLHSYRLVIERNDSLALWRFPEDGAQQELGKQPPRYSPFWVKYELLERHLPTTKWALWFDSDVVFVSLPDRLEPLLSRLASPTTDLIVLGSQGADVADLLRSTLCACIFAVRNSAGGWWFALRWFALRKFDNLWGDQGAFAHAVLEMHMRYNASIDPNGDGLPWYTPSYASIKSPCLHSHWSLSSAAVDLPCIGEAMRALAGRPAVDTRTDWPVAWSSELAASMNGNQDEGRWPEKRERVTQRVMRNKRTGPADRPVLMAHTKTGFRHPLMTMYHKGAISRLAELCPAQITAVNSTVFVQGALLDESAPSWKLETAVSAARRWARWG